MSTSLEKRLFFALWPTAGVRAGWSELFADCVIQPSVPDERRHLTLAYLGEVTQAQEQSARRVADNLRSEPFSFRLDRYGCFEKQRVVWMGCQDYCNVLQCLVMQLREGLSMQKLPVETRPFTPHMTLLRKHRQVPEDWHQPDIRWMVKDFVLVHSHRQDQGLCYDLIGHWSLSGGLS